MDMEELSEKPSTSKKNKKRMQNFSSDLKQSLAAEVKARPRIWDITDRLHCRKDALDKSWMEISEVIGRSVSDCKSAWASLRESCRYHARVSRKGKSGDAGGVVLDEPLLTDSVDWEFANDMAFLPSNSQKRSTFQTFDPSPSPSPSLEDLESPNLVDTESSAATYDYIPQEKRRKVQNNTPNQILDRVGVLLDSQIKLQDIRAKSGKSESAFEQALSTFDWLLNKLPKSTADELCEDFTQTLLTKVSEERAKKSQSQ